MNKISKVISIAVLAVGISSSFVSAEGYEFSQKAYKVGMDHQDIKVLQEALKKEGSFTQGATTSYFGSITEKAVISFQKKNGLQADGVVGKGTIDKLNEIGLIQSSGNNASVAQVANTTIAAGHTFALASYKKGMTHNDVKMIQEALKKNGIFTASKTTTYFGTETEKAVMAFQKNAGLSADGVVGIGTLNKMKELGLMAADVKLTSTPVSAPITRGIVSRSAGQGQQLDWFKEVSGKIVSRQDVLTIEDVETGKRFQVQVTAGTNHADCEALTYEDTQVMKEIWGGFSWDRRAVLVYKDDLVIAASMTNMPHAGVESKPGGETVSNRSGGYGKGYNYDFIKGNGMEGHVDLHFKNSRTHGTNKIDSKHQNAIKVAAGLK